MLRFEVCACMVDFLYIEDLLLFHWVALNSISIPVRIETLLLCIKRFAAVGTTELLLLAHRTGIEA